MKMQDNLSIALPILPNDSSARLRPTKEMPVLNPIDMTKVTPKDNTENSQNAKNGETFQSLLNHNSVFQRFVSQLTLTPGLSQTLKKVMFEVFTGEGSVTKAGVSEALIKDLAVKLQMNPEEIVEALKYQHDNQTKFSGKLFDAFRQLLSNSGGDKEFEQLLGRFLKSYNGFFSTPDTMKAIQQNLKTIAQSIPASHAKELQVIVDKLITIQPSASLDINLTTLKNEVIPFLSQYIAKTNDFGKARDTITLLINNIARLNSGSREDVITKFVDVVDFCKYYFELPNNKIDQLKNMFAAKINQVQEQKNEVFEAITKLLSEATASNSANASKGVYRDITSTLLLDNSVFMPITHLFLPVNFEGNFMFTEVWVDKDAGRNSENDTNAVPITKLFVTFDIKGLGYFEATVVLSDKKADIEVSYPETMTNREKDIRNNLATILAKNGFSPNVILLQKNAPPKRLQDVFNLFDQRRSVDVTV